MSNTGLEHKGRVSQNGFLAAFFVPNLPFFPKNSKNVLKFIINAEIYTAKTLTKTVKKTQLGEFSTCLC